MAVAVDRVPSVSREKREKLARQNAEAGPKDGMESDKPPAIDSGNLGAMLERAPLSDEWCAHHFNYLAPEFAANRWFPYHDSLAAHFEVYAPDHLGFGESERPEWLEGVDDLVFHYVDLLNTLGLERVSVIGTSLGGWVAAEFAVAHPQRVERLVRPRFGQHVKHAGLARGIRARADARPGAHDGGGDAHSG
jgi:hypothetical protein